MVDVLVFLGVRYFSVFFENFKREKKELFVVGKARGGGSSAVRHSGGVVGKYSWQANHGKRDTPSGHGWGGGN